MDLANQIERILKAPFQSIVQMQPQEGQFIFPIISTSDEQGTLDDEEGNEDIQVEPVEDAGAQGGQSKYSIVFSAKQSNRWLTIESMDVDSSSSRVFGSTTWRFYAKDLIPSGL